MEAPLPRKPGRRSTQSTSVGLRLQKILAPVDFLGSTWEVLRHAASFAREYQATITLLHVVEPDGSHVKRNISREQLIDEMREAHEQALRKLVDVLWGEAIAADVMIATGKPHRQIVNEAREAHSDLIIMGSHGPVGAWGLFRRNTTVKVIRNAPCPVLVVQALERGCVRDGSIQNCPDR